jgi:hypothetical protein
MVIKPTFCSASSPSPSPTSACSPWRVECGSSRVLMITGSFYAMALTTTDMANVTCFADVRQGR